LCCDFIVQFGDDVWGKLGDRQGPRLMCFPAPRRQKVCNTCCIALVLRLAKLYKVISFLISVHYQVYVELKLHLSSFFFFFRSCYFLFCLIPGLHCLGSECIEILFERAVRRKSWSLCHQVGPTQNVQLRFMELPAIKLTFSAVHADAVS
jgi:hypothetical protein